MRRPGIRRLLFERLRQASHHVPWGFGRRTAVWALTFSPRRAVRGALHVLRPAPFERPVFVLGVPRSGTSTVFSLLCFSPELGSLGREGYGLWTTFHHPRCAGWRSEAVGAGEVRRGERRYVNAYLRAFVRQPRFVEKTPSNVFRVPYLLELFPDAYVVEIRRDPCDVISSMINGWRHPWRFTAHHVPEKLEVPGTTPSRRWRFPLIEGWRKLRHGPIHEIAFAQWAACVRALTDARGRVDPARWVTVHLEHLVARPQAVLERLCDRIGIAVTAEMRRMANKLAREPVNALSPPARDKWRKENEAEILALMPRIADLAPLAGYRIRRTATGAWTAEPAPSRL